MSHDGVVWLLEWSDVMDAFPSIFHARRPELMFLSAGIRPALLRQCTLPIWRKVIRWTRRWRERGAQQGIRDFEAIDRAAQKSGLKLWQDVAMPANSRLLIFTKI